VSEVIPKRIDKCGSCDKWCPPGEFYCCGHCRAAADERSAERFVGGSLERHALDEEARPLRDRLRETVGGTRNPRENSQDGDGYA
jgi:hypothetical protein